MAAAIALLALGSIVAMVKTSMLAGGLQGVASTAWCAAGRAAGYFSTLTALIVAVDLGSVAAGWAIPARRAAGLVVWTAMIAAVYHLILAPFWQAPGVTNAADVALHSALPALVLLWWAAYAPKRGLRPAMAFGWLVWPVTYATYVLVRGLVTGFWPYPFADPDALGPGRLSVNVALLCAGVLGLGLLVTVAARRLQSRRPS